MMSDLRSDQMIIFTRVLILNLLLFCLVSRAEDLIPFENKILNLWGYRSQKTGDIVIDTKYYEIGSFRNELSLVRIGQLWRVINFKGEMIITHIFSNVGNFRMSTSG